jgi:F-type H+-transporting ATPase subunit beta
MPLMGQFYVFHASPRHRARIHDGECKYCRNGRGFQIRGKNGSGVTGWDGPFSTVQEADAKMATFKFKDAGCCKYCLGA